MIIKEMRFKKIEEVNDWLKTNEKKINVIDIKFNVDYPPTNWSTKPDKIAFISYTYNKE